MRNWGEELVMLRNAGSNKGGNGMRLGADHELNEIAMLLSRVYLN